MRNKEDPYQTKAHHWLSITRIVYIHDTMCYCIIYRSKTNWWFLFYGISHSLWQTHSS